MNVLITGTSSGLGLELAGQFLASGHTVVGLSRSKSLIDHSRYHPLTADIGKALEVWAAAERCALSTIDIIINNAGLPGAGRRIDEVDPSEVQQLLDVNLFGALHVVQAFLPRLRAGTTKRIVNISSRFGSLSFNQRAENRRLRISYSYRISKAAQNMLAVCLANELADEGVAVEVLHPGSFQSNCGRAEATLLPFEVAARIYKWLLSGLSSSEPRMFEIGGSEFDW